MYPIVFELPILHHAIPGYGLMLMLGFLAAIWWAAKRAEKSRANPDVILNCGFICLFAGVIGCRAMYVIHYWDQFANAGNWFAVTWAIVNVSRGGLEFYGGFIASAVAVLFYLWRWGHSVRWYLDIIAPSAALGLAFGRIGCFLNGCCFGGACNLPWAVEFPFGSSAAIEQWTDKRAGSALPEQLLYSHAPGFVLPITRDSLMATDDKLAAADEGEKQARSNVEALRQQVTSASAADKPALDRKLRLAEFQLQQANLLYRDMRTNMERYGMTAAQIRALAAKHAALPVHPTQLYSSFTALLLAIFLGLLYWRRSFDGQVIGVLLFVQPIARFVLELIRTDNPLDTFGLTISQFLALGLSAVGLLMLLTFSRMPARSPRARVWEPPQDDGKPGKGKKSGAAPAGA